MRTSDKMIVDTGGSDGTDTDKSDVYMLVYYYEYSRSVLLVLVFD